MAQSAPSKKQAGFDDLQQDSATEYQPTAPMGYQPFGPGAAGLGQYNLPHQMYNNGFQGPHDVMGDPYGGAFNGNGAGHANAVGPSVFVNGSPQYHTQYHGGYLPFGLAAQPPAMHPHAGAGPAQLGGATYQTGGGSTFFHQGCNIQYTDVKTFTTTIHLHCGGVGDGKSPHQGFCPEAAQGQATNPHHCQQTLHYTQTLPGQQHHHNVFNGAPQSYSAAPMAVVYATGPAPEGHHGSYSQPHNYEGPRAPAQDAHNDFVIDEYQIPQEGAQSRGNQNNQSGSYQSSSKANLNGRTGHSRRAGGRNASFSSRRGMAGRSASNKNNFRTKNFLNQTMTQINKGKDRELNPLYSKRNAACTSMANGFPKAHPGTQGTPYHATPQRVPAPFSMRPQQAGASPPPSAPSASKEQIDLPRMASPEMIKRRKEAAPDDLDVAGGSQFHSERMTQESTPMTSKNHMFQSPGPTQSYARMHALYGSTPAPGPFMMSE